MAGQCNVGLWEKAYDALKSDQPSLIAAYETFLRAHGTTATTVPQPFDGIDREQEMSSLLKTQIDAVLAARTKIRVWPGKDIGVREIYDRIVEKIVVAQGFISQAVSGEPHAALAWAGVSVVLPLLINPTKQDAEALAGLEKVSEMVLKYRVIELRLCSPSNVANVDMETLLVEMKQGTRRLFSQILEYQIRLARQLSRSKVFQVLRNVIASDDWASMLKEIEASDKAILAQFQAFDSETVHSAFREQNVQSEALLALAAQQDRRVQDVVESLHVLQDSVDTVDRTRKERWKQIDRERCLNAFACGYDYQAGKKRIASRILGTCEWVLGHEKYKHWRDSSTSNLLFITAEPGCGKTVLSKHLVEVLGSALDQRMVCYYFFKVDSAPQRSVVHAFRALVTQLMSQHTALVETILSNQYWRENLAVVAGQASTLWEILLACVKACPKEVNVVIDALDECEVEDRQLLIELFNDFYREARDDAVTFKVLVTGRPYFNVEFRFQDLVAELPLESHLAGEDTHIGGEMGLVIRAQVQSMRLDQHVKDFLIDRLLVFQDKTRTYLLLRLLFENIRNNPDLKHANERKLSRFIENLPTTVFGAYEQFLERCADRSQADVLLRIVLAAYEPLTIEEINVAFTIARNADEDFDGTSYSEFEDEMQPSEDFRVTMRSVCGLFVTIWENKVYLIHQTAREFLLSHEIRSTDIGPSAPPRWQHSMELSACHLLFTRICLLYILLDDFGTLDWESAFHNTFGLLSCQHSYHGGGGLWTLSRQYPFLKYISKYFFDHLNSSMDVPILTEQALKLLEHQGGRIAILILSRFHYMGYVRIQEFDATLAGLLAEDQVRGDFSRSIYPRRKGSLLYPHDIAAIILSGARDLDLTDRLAEYHDDRKCEMKTLVLDPPPSPLLRGQFWGD